MVYRGWEQSLKRSGLQKQCGVVSLLEACSAGGWLLVHVNCGVHGAGEEIFKTRGDQRSLGLSVR